MCGRKSAIPKGDRMEKQCEVMRLFPDETYIFHTVQSRMDSETMSGLNRSEHNGMQLLKQKTERSGGWGRRHPNLINQKNSALRLYGAGGYNKNQ